MRLSIRQIRYIKDVAQFGSILAASEALHISASSIVAAINLAEGELGTALFERRPSRGVVATPAGEKFVRAAQMLLTAEAEFERTIATLKTRNKPSSEIRIGCFEPFGSLFMPDLIQAYVGRGGVPNVSLFEGDQNELHNWLVSGTVDLVIAYDIGPSFNGNVTPICQVPAHVIVAADDLLASRKAVSLREIADRPLVLLDLPHTGSYLLALFDGLELHPRIAFRTRSYTTVSRAVAAGFGVSVGNTSPLSIAEHEDDGIVRLQLVDKLVSPTLVIADGYGADKPDFVRSFITTAQELFLNSGRRLSS
ncbi:HTH-type transcriptional regulator CysB [bacterium YEK0313]|nr:HTH-type transcriptional regulator CysB [bacterium YEK0313]